VEFHEAREHRLNVIYVDLLECTEQPPLLEKRKTQIAFLRILVALKIAALGARNRDVERLLLVVTVTAVGDRDGDTAKTISTAEDVVRP